MCVCVCERATERDCVFVFVLVRVCVCVHARVCGVINRTLLLSVAFIFLSFSLSLFVLPSRKIERENQ